MMPPDNTVQSILDPDWYKLRYPDVETSGLDPLDHFLRFGLTEQRDPNGYFDSKWYLEQYPDVAVSGASPLRHYLESGATELRDPHPRFDTNYYVSMHPEAAANPLLFHLQIGRLRGYLTEKPTHIQDYLPSNKAPLDPTANVLVDIVVPICTEGVILPRWIEAGSSVASRIIVIDDATSDSVLASQLRSLAKDRRIVLIRNRRRLGLSRCVNQGLDAAANHDVVLLLDNVEMPSGSLERLAAQAWAEPLIATVSPLGYFDNPPNGLDEICRTINAGRSVTIPDCRGACVYIRRDALSTIGPMADDADMSGTFSRRALATGWQHRLACDVAVDSSSIDQRDLPTEADPFRFAAMAAMFRQSGQPVILMVAHNLGGGVKRHIHELAERYHGSAHVLLLTGSERNVSLSAPIEPYLPTLTLPSSRVGDLVAVLRSTGLSRVHIHHQMHLGLDIRRLIQRLGVPFDVTVHDYFAICPQVNLLRVRDGFYCGEPDIGSCNACIADVGSHGAKDIVLWRLERAWQFLEADRVICPSADVMKRLARHGFQHRMIVAPHEPADAGPWPIAYPKRFKPPVRVVLLGVLANHKGARIVASVAAAADRKRIRLHLIGRTETDFPEQAAALIEMTGQYEEADFTHLLQNARPHVFWFPSTAPETYSYTLTAAIASGLPIVAPNLGSFPERLAGRPNTWIIDHRATTEDYLAVFEEVRLALETAEAPNARSLPPTHDNFYASRYLMPQSQRMAATKARRRIAIVPERLPDGVPTPHAYARLLLPLTHPAIAADLDIVLTNPASVLDTQADIIVAHRLSLTDIATVDRVKAQARRTGARLLYDLDDDLLSASPTVVRRMLTVADAVWVSTPALAARVAAIRSDVTVLDDRLDERLWASPPMPLPPWDDPVRILYIGSDEEDRDFTLIEPILVRLKSEYAERIVIDILGMSRTRTLPTGLNHVVPPAHGIHSYPAFVHWIKSVAPRWHIGLAPLLERKYNACKSPIKVLHYAALGLATLASDIPLHRGSLADGQSGQLVPNKPMAWFAALDWLIRNQTLRRRLGQTGPDAVLRHAKLNSQADQRLAAFRISETERS